MRLKNITRVMRDTSRVMRFEQMATVTNRAGAPP